MYRPMHINRLMQVLKHLSVYISLCQHINLQWKPQCVLCCYLCNYFIGAMYPTSMRINDEGRLVVNFKTEARFRGQFVMSHPGNPKYTDIGADGHSHTHTCCQALLSIVQSSSSSLLLQRCICKIQCNVPPKSKLPVITFLEEAFTALWWWQNISQTFFSKSYFSFKGSFKRKRKQMIQRLCAVDAQDDSN